MPEYGSVDYWNDRYAGEADGFDWLFDYGSIRSNLERILPRGGRILVVGCGNADFSVELEKAGYPAVHIDLSEVVIQQMRQRHPGIDWRVMDVLDMDFEAESFDAVIDKSLIDTLLCYDHSVTRVGEMVQEIHRVLRPGGVYVTMSLHDPEEVLPFLDATRIGEPGALPAGEERSIAVPRIPLPTDWVVEHCRLRNPRWNGEDGRARALCHTFVLCTKMGRGAHEPFLFKGALKDADIEMLRQDHGAGFASPATLQDCTVPEMMEVLDGALQTSLGGGCHWLPR